MWRKIALGLAGLLLALAAIVATRPSAYRVERSAHVSAPSRMVYERISDFHRWAEWSPWAHVDPDMRQSFEGAPAGTGAEYTWSGNSQIGEGRMSITEARPDELVAIRIDFARPLRTTSTTELRLLPEGGGVRVTWAMEGRRDFVGKAVALVASVDDIVARDFEQGLDDLRRVAEGEATSGAAAP
jgi:hypothetical protein